MVYGSSNVSRSTDSIHSRKWFVAWVQAVAVCHWAALWIIGLVVIPGCGNTAGPYAVREDLARETLNLALESWQSGQSAASLREREPPVVVQDFDWSAGKRLKEFSVLTEGEALDANLSVQVRLVLMDEKGSSAAKEVWYLIGTDPALTVFRDSLR